MAVAATERLHRPGKNTVHDSRNAAGVKPIGVGDSRLVDLPPGFMAETDRRLVAELRDRYAERGPVYETPWGLHVRHQELGSKVRPTYNSATFLNLAGTLLANGAFDTHAFNGHKLRIDGKEHPITLVPATDSETKGDMTEQYWVRDATQVFRSDKEALKVSTDKGSPRYESQKKRAKNILLGAVDVMSTRAQREDRFDAIIKDPSVADDPENWPQIAVHIQHLDSEVPSPWRQNQEAFQMLGIETIDAIDNKIISVKDLAGDNKEFLGAMMPFLAAVNFSERENVGSWEEIPAIRSSVVGVETALLHGIRKHADKPKFAFFREGFKGAKEHLLRNKDKTSFKDTDFNEQTTFEQALDIMIDKGLKRIGEQFPHEAPSHGLDSAKYTAADGALLYLLDYNIPQLLAEKQIPIKAADGEALAVDEIEDVILGEVGKLYDDETHGLKRYGAQGDPNKDTYLRMWTPGVLDQVNKMKDALRKEADATGQPLDLEKKRRWRAEIVPEGPEATWTHFNAQISAWAARRYLETGQPFYLNRAEETYNRMVAMVTGEGEHNVIINGDNTYRLQEVAPFRLSESITSILTEEGERITFPSPNTQLEWAAAKGFEATALLGAAIVTRDQLAKAA